MANPLEFKVKESISELKKLLKSEPVHMASKIRMLLIAVQSNKPMSKNDLARQVGVNPNSIQSWRSTYLRHGISDLLKDGRIGFKPSVISKQSHKKIEKKLNNPQQGFTSYRELQVWVDENLEKGINYNTLRHYVKRKFGAKLKVARKSHINKDPKAGEAFKKNSNLIVKKK